MHARMMTFQVRPGMIDQMIGLVRDSLVPVAASQQGFRGGFALTDRERERVVGVTLWDSEADMIAGENNTYLQGQLGKLADLVESAPVREHYEVSLRV